MKINPRGRLAVIKSTNTSSSSAGAGGLAQPQPLGPQLQYLKEGDDTVLVSPDQSPQPTT